MLKFFSTKRIANADLVALSKRLQSFSGSPSLPGEFTVDAVGAKVSRFADLGAFFSKGLPDWSGRLTVVFGNGEGVSGRCELMRIPKRKNSVSDGKSAMYRAHEFLVEIAPALRNTDNNVAVVDLFKSAAELLGVVLAVGHDDDGFLAELHSARGLEDGLPGVYRLMVLGKEFVEMMSFPNGRRIPAQTSERLASGALYIQLDAEPTSETPSDMRARQALIKSALGAQYFRNPSEGKLDLPGGQIGLLTFVSALLRSKGDYESSERRAQVTPKVDWSGVFDEFQA